MISYFIWIIVGIIIILVNLVRLFSIKNKTKYTWLEISAFSFGLFFIISKFYSDPKRSDENYALKSIIKIASR